MLLRDAIVVLVGGGGEDDGDIAVGTLPENFAGCHEGQLIVHENPGDGYGRELLEC